MINAKKEENFQFYKQILRLSATDEPLSQPYVVLP
jgi:hypothetical protein